MPRPPTSERALRFCMQALVFLNLVFIQMTGAAGVQWLGPLFVLTLAAPLLERFRERTGYTLLWNVGVVCFFLVLVKHAMRADLAFVRESGLVLAVLCQVHLLNNLRSNQRPDLLFFNAFLIAIITGFMTRGVGFPLAFLLFAPCFVVGLQLLSATRGGHVLTPEVTRRFVRDAARRAVGILAASVLVFLFWPRDFERKAFFHGRIDLNRSGSELEIGFNEELLLNRKDPVTRADRPAMRITLLEGRTVDVPSLWRGATLAATDGQGWHPLGPVARRRAPSLDERWQGRRGRLARPGSEVTEPGVRIEVTRFAQETERLFMPLGARALQLASDQAHLLLRPRLDGTVDVAEMSEVRYELALAGPVAGELGGSHPGDLGPALLPYVELPDSWRVERARELAERLMARLPTDAEQYERVQLVSEHLGRSYVYLAPGADGAARSLEEFLRGDAGGHCEFFASALATMLRSQEIPCRVVTGLRSTRWDETGVTLSFGMRDAHAWVEVYDPAAGWYAVDPSPVLSGAHAGTSLFARLRSKARAAWQSVTSFDAERRAAVFAWLRGLPARSMDAFRTNPWGASAVAMSLALAVVWAVRRSRARVLPSVRAYRRAVRQSKIRLLSGETPRELLDRARTLGVPAKRLRVLEQATRRHELTRYAA